MRSQRSCHAIGQSQFVQKIHPWTALSGIYEGLILGQEILVSSEPGKQRSWCAPGDVSRVLFQDPSAIVAVILSMLRQATHPTISQAFVEHDSALENPFRRVHLTSGFYFATTYGTGEDALSWVARARHGHRPVRGREPNGYSYSASSSELLTWAHLCVLDSTIRAWDSFGPGPALSENDADRFCREQALPATLIGVSDPPMSKAALQLALAAAVPTPHSRYPRIAVNTVLQPALPRWARGGYTMLAQGALSLLTDQELTTLQLSGPAIPRAAELPIHLLRKACPQLSVARIAAQRDRVTQPDPGVVPNNPILITGRDWEAGRRWAGRHPEHVPWAASWFVSRPAERESIGQGAPAEALTRSSQVRLAAVAGGAWATAVDRGWPFVWRRMRRRS